MKGLFLCLLCVAATLAGCGGQAESPPTAETPTPEAPPVAQAPPAAAPAAPAPTGESKYDAGPRAGESPVNAALASQGERLFQSKGCAVCHGFGKKVTCPDLVGVSMRRTALWMEQQILHPEIMAKEDPISYELKKGYPLPMTNQGVKPDEARALIEFLKRKDREARAAS